MSLCKGGEDPGRSHGARQEESSPRDPTQSLDENLGSVSSDPSPAAAGLRDLARSLHVSEFGMLTPFG